jgi:hypothetical protein
VMNTNTKMKNIALVAVAKNIHPKQLKQNNQINL